MNGRRSSARRWLIRTALAYLGTPYIWGGDDPSGFDCSGLAVEALRSAGLLDGVDFSADALMNRYASQTVTEPSRGCLVFILNAQGRAVHVGICLDRLFMIEAGGGGAQVTDADSAWRKNAFVKIRPIPSNGSRRRICDPFLTIKE
jgi:cell wall-associated NlpC family hydrolase